MESQRRALHQDGETRSQRGLVRFPGLTLEEEVESWLEFSRKAKDSHTSLEYA